MHHKFEIFSGMYLDLGILIIIFMIKLYINIAFVISEGVIKIECLTIL